MCLDAIRIRPSRGRRSLRSGAIHWLVFLLARRRYAMDSGARMSIGHPRPRRGRMRHVGGRTTCADRNSCPGTCRLISARLSDSKPDLRIGPRDSDPEASEMHVTLPANSVSIFPKPRSTFSSTTLSYARTRPPHADRVAESGIVHRKTPSKALRCRARDAVSSLQR